MPDPGFTAKKIQEAVDLTAQNMDAKDKATAKGIFGKIIIAGISIVGIILLILLIKFNFNVYLVADKIMTGGKDLLNWFSSEAFNTKTPIREPIATQPDIPKEKAKASASETPSDIENQIKNGGGIKIWKAPSPVVASQPPAYQPVIVPQPQLGNDSQAPKVLPEVAPKAPEIPAPTKSPSPLDDGVQGSKSSDPPVVTDPVKAKVDASNKERPEDVFKSN